MRETNNKNNDTPPPQDKICNLFIFGENLGVADEGIWETTTDTDRGNNNKKHHNHYQQKTTTKTIK